MTFIQLDTPWPIWARIVMVEFVRDFIDSKKISGDVTVSIIDSEESTVSLPTFSRADGLTRSVYHSK